MDRATNVGPAICDLCSVRLATVDPHTVSTRSQLCSTTHIKHWMIPEPFHEKLIKTRLLTRKDCQDAVISACYMCHQAAINYFTDAERLWHLSSPPKLRSALQAIGWHKIRTEEPNFTPAKLKNFVWVTQKVEDFKRKVFTFSDASYWSDDADRESLVSLGEMYDMFEQQRKEAEARERRLEARLTERLSREFEDRLAKHTADIASVKEVNHITSDQVESLKNRVGGLAERLNERVESDSSGEAVPDLKKLSRANKELIGILRRDLDELIQEHGACKRANKQADQARDGKLQRLTSEIKSLKASEVHIEHMRKRVQGLEWKLAEVPPATTDANSEGKGKGKRKRTDEDVAQTNRKNDIQRACTESDSSDEESDDDSDSSGPLQSRVPPAKKQRGSHGNEVKAPIRFFAKRRGQLVSSGKSSATGSGTTQKTGQAAHFQLDSPAAAIYSSSGSETAVDSAASGKAPSVAADNGCPATVTKPASGVTPKEPPSGTTKAPMTFNSTAPPTKRAARPAAVPLHSTAIIASAMAETTAVDLPPSWQAEAASSSGTSKILRTVGTSSSDFPPGKREKHVSTNPSGPAKHGRPSLYPSSRQSASDKASTEAEAMRNRPGGNGTRPFTDSVNSSVETPAQSASGSIASTLAMLGFPPLAEGEEDSDESALPDISDLFKQAETRRVCADGVQERMDVIYVKSKLGDGYGAKRRRKQKKSAAVKEENC